MVQNRINEPSAMDDSFASPTSLKLALHFGCKGEPGHYLRTPNGRTIWEPKRDYPGFPWNMGHLDTGLLQNGEHPDIYDGKVWWTCGGSPLWYAFFWWDRSGDSRGASNSGFYVRGFEWPDVQAAFDYACTTFPKIVTRQKQPLILQGLVDVGGEAVHDETVVRDHSAKSSPTSPEEKAT